MKSLGSFIRYQRKRKGLTQDEIADSLNIVTPVLSKWENDKGVPALSYICKLCSVLEISIEDCIACEKTENDILPPESYDAVALGNTVKDLRIKNDWSQEEVGKKLFVTSQTVSKWENGGVSSLDILQKLSEIFEVSPTALLNGFSGSGTVKPTPAPQPVKPKRKIKTVMAVIVSLLLAAAVALGSWGISVAVKKSRYQEPDETDFCLPLIDAECYRQHGEIYLNSSQSPAKWTEHKGVDFSAESGEQVYAVANGTVASLADIYGGIVIEHSNGFKSKYYGVTPVDGLNAGDEVKKGAVIATINSQPYGFEFKESPHLHFELYDESGDIDPLTKIKTDGDR